MNYGKIVKLTFDNKVYYISNKERTRFRLLNVYDEAVYPKSVTAGANENEVYLHFDDINLFGANRLECFETIEMGSKDIRIGAFVRDIWLDGLMPSDNSFVELTSISVSGEIEQQIVFDGKGYADNQYIELTTISVSGSIIDLNFVNAPFNASESYIRLNSIIVTGQYTDLSGVPL